MLFRSVAALRTTLADSAATARAAWLCPCTACCRTTRPPRTRTSRTTLTETSAGACVRLCAPVPALVFGSICGRGLTVMNVRARTQVHGFPSDLHGVPEVRQVLPRRGQGAPGRAAGGRSQEAEAGHGRCGRPRGSQGSGSDLPCYAHGGGGRAAEPEIKLAASSEDVEGGFSPAKLPEELVAYNAKRRALYTADATNQWFAPTGEASAFLPRGEVAHGLCAEPFDCLARACSVVGLLRSVSVC